MSKNRFKIEDLVNKGLVADSSGVWSKPSKKQIGSRQAKETGQIEASEHTIHEQEIRVKPLSVNQCWRGRRFKTPKYKKYESVVGSQLKRIPMPLPPFRMEIVLYMANHASDLDNPVKPLLDILQQKYGFNDKEIIELNVKKKKIEKGKEKIFYCITHCQ